LEYLLALIPPATALLVIAPLIRRLVKNWRAAAEKLGYAYVPGPFGTLGQIVGTHAHARVVVTLVAGETLQIMVHGARLPNELTILRRGLVPRRNEIETGDFQFDGHLSVTGPIDIVFAALTLVVRMRLGRLAEDGRVSVRDSTLTLSRNHPRASADLIAVIEDAVDLFERMTWSDPIDERLLDSFESDRVPAVRERLFKLLLQQASDRVRQRAIKRALEDLNPEVRLAAVKAMKSAGWEEAVALYQDRKMPMRYRAEALRHVALTFGRERAMPLIESALKVKSPEIVMTAVEAIGGWRHAAALPELAGLLSREPAVVERVASALGRIGGDFARDLLLTTLGHPDREVRLAAIAALGRAGTLEVIPVLARIKDFGSKAAAREAIAAIQARCGRDAEGALSLPRDSSQEGGVSLSDESGQMSILDARPREK
jgi:HEAT repeat protein